MRGVTFITVVWLLCWSALWVCGALMQFGNVTPEAEQANRELAHMAILFWIPALLGTPVVAILWIVRFVVWATKRPETPALPVGFKPPPPPPPPKAAYTITGRRIQ